MRLNRSYIAREKKNIEDWVLWYSTLKGQEVRLNPLPRGVEGTSDREIGNWKPNEATLPRHRGYIICYQYINSKNMLICVICCFVIKAQKCAYMLLIGQVKRLCINC